jgi:hypothetical protein
VRAPIEAALAKGMIVLTGDGGEVEFDREAGTVRAVPVDECADVAEGPQTLGTPAGARLGFLEAVSSGQRAEVPTP